MSTRVAESAANMMPRNNSENTGRTELLTSLDHHSRTNLQFTVFMTIRYKVIMTRFTDSNKCIGFGDDTKAAARQRLKCIKTKKLNMTKNDFQYGGWNSYTLQ